VVKRILVAFAALVAVLAYLPSVASAASSPSVSDPRAATSEVSKAGDTTADPRLCNYRVWAAEGVNIHRSPDRSSAIVGHRPLNYVFRNITCANTVGGNYGSCGTGNLWKSLGNSYVATKCLVPA
jgi:hypothetical protein